MQKVYIVGCGYTGQRLAQRLAPEAVVEAIARHAPSSSPWLTHVCDLDREPCALDFRNALIYYLVPPPAEGRSDSRLRHFLGAIDEHNLPARLVLISTTGVYGDNGGDWVSETTPAAPRFDRAWRRLDAETALAEWAGPRQVPTVILRIPAIYGPGRLPEKTLRAGRPMVNMEESPWVNRIFVDDLVSFCVAAGRPGAPTGLFNISDGHPERMTEYFFRVADILGLPRPRQISLREARDELSAGMNAYLSESRRIDNHKAMQAFAVDLCCPTLDQGLPRCVEPGQ